jgi:hypothetical protein
MALDTFVFTVTLPPRPESVALFREISAHMSRYIGLGPAAAEEAGEVLNRLLADRIARVGEAGGPIRISFERPQEAETVSVEIATADVPGGGDPVASALVSTRREGGVLRLRLTWEPDGDE